LITFTADRNRTIQHPDLDLVLRRGLHDLDQGRKVGIGSNPNVLDVEDDDIQPLENLVRRASIRAKQAVDRGAGGGVLRIGHLRPRCRGPPGSMLRPEDRLQLNPLRPGEQIDEADETTVHSRWIGDHTDLLSLELLEAAGRGNLEASSNTETLRTDIRGRHGSGRKQENGAKKDKLVRGAREHGFYCCDLC
jgi:hypothetical protein